MKKVLYFLLAMPLIFGMVSCSDNNGGDEPDDCPTEADNPDAIVGAYSVSYALTVNGETVALSKPYGQVAITQGDMNDEIDVHCTYTPISLRTSEIARNVLSEIKIENIKLTGAVGDRTLNFDGVASIYLEDGFNGMIPTVVTGTLKKYPATRTTCENGKPQSTYQELNMVISMQIDMLDMDGANTTFEVVFTISPIAS